MEEWSGRPKGPGEPSSGLKSCLARLFCTGFGSGDCPNTPLVWRDLEVDAELRAWRYHKPQSPFSSAWTA